MILNVSGRTDIVAFYSKWFMNRYNEGYVDVRNPFYPKLVNTMEVESGTTQNDWIGSYYAVGDVQFH